MKNQNVLLQILKISGREDWFTKKRPQYKVAIKEAITFNQP